MAWTFAGATFEWLEEDTITPTWKREARLDERPLLGLGDVDVNRLGYGAWKMKGRARVETELNYNALEDANGTQGTLSDGTDSWTAYLKFDMNPIVSGIGGYEGMLEFIRPTP